MKPTYRILCCGATQPVEYACAELRKYLRMMMPEAGNIPLEHGDKADGIRVGTFGDLGLPQEAADPKTDDILGISVQNGIGYITGSNPRSVLAAVYRYLHENGCRWPRPGADGELIPRKEPSDVLYRHEASYRHRGLCIEGAVSYQNMLENIEWAPKVGYNAYFLEFRTPYTFFDLWYTHRSNPRKESEKVSLGNVRQWCVSLETEIQKRGLEYHAVGHAWTCEPFGIDGLGWDQSQPELPAETRELLAQVGGKRELFKGVALNTNLCYSNPSARKKIVDYCADYAEKNSHIAYLHIWLADGINNHCECESCQKALPSDFYITLLNEIDAEFTRRGITMKLVFLIYVDLLWPPEKSRLHNPDRFSLLFAPITRTYSEPYSTEPYPGELPPYRRNDLVFPGSVTENLEYLRQWKKIFDGDTFAYEYYFWLDHYFDPGYYKMARTISLDVKRMRKLGIDGLVSDQTQRSFLPTGFPMYVMGQTLYNDSLSFEELAKDFFGTFGEDGELCREYMEKLSSLFHPEYLRGDGAFGHRLEHSIEISLDGVAEDLGQVACLVDSFLPVVEKNAASQERCVSRSWRFLRFHGELCKRLAAAWKARAEGKAEESRRLWEETKDYACLHEDEVQDSFDAYLFIHAFERSAFRKEDQHA